MPGWAVLHHAILPPAGMGGCGCGGQWQHGQLKHIRCETHSTKEKRPPWAGHCMTPSPKSMLKKQSHTHAELEVCWLKQRLQMMMVADDRMPWPYDPLAVCFVHSCAHRHMLGPTDAGEQVFQDCASSLDLPILCLLTSTSHQAVHFGGMSVTSHSTVDVGNIRSSMSSLFGDDSTARSMDYNKYIGMAKQVCASYQQYFVCGYNVCDCTLCYLEE